MRPCFVTTAFAFVFLAAATASAQQPPERTSFERPFALGGYATGWEGAYAGVGLGGRARWEMLDWLGVELFAETLLVESPGGTRHDHPVGFNLFVPWRISEHVRIRPLFGFCAVISMIEPDQEGGPRADDVLFGVHGGAGVEWAPFDAWSLFIEAQAVAYVGHDRRSQGWTGAVSEDLKATALGQIAMGVQLHLGG